MTRLQYGIMNTAMNTHSSPPAPAPPRSNVRQERRRFFRQMIRQRGDVYFNIHRRWPRGLLRWSWTAYAAYMAVQWNSRVAYRIANLERHNVYWSPLLTVIGAVATMEACIRMAAFTWQVRLQTPLARQYSNGTTTQQVTAVVVECQYAPVSPFYKVVVVYPYQTLQDEQEQESYYAKVFLLRDLLQHGNETFPLLVLSNLPTSAASQRQIWRLKWWRTFGPFVLSVAFLAAMLHWFIRPTRARTRTQTHAIDSDYDNINHPSDRNEDVESFNYGFWMGHVTVCLLLGYLRIRDQNQRLLNGGARKVPAAWIPQAIRNTRQQRHQQTQPYREMYQNEIENDNQHQHRFDHEKHENEQTQVQEYFVDEDETRIHEEMDELVLHDEHDDYNVDEIMTHNQTLNTLTPMELDQNDIDMDYEDDKCDIQAANRADYHHDDCRHQQNPLVATQTQKDSYKANSSLWDKLDLDYQLWLQKTHGVSSTTFGAMGLAKRLQLRASYYDELPLGNTQGALSTADLGDELGNCTSGVTMRRRKDKATSSYASSSSSSKDKRRRNRHKRKTKSPISASTTRPCNNSKRNDIDKDGNDETSSKDKKTLYWV